MNLSIRPMCLGHPVDYRTLWEEATSHFSNIYAEHEYRFKFYVCDQLWCLRDWKVVEAAMAAHLLEHSSVQIFNNCYNE